MTRIPALPSTNPPLSRSERKQCQALDYSMIHQNELTGPVGHSALALEINCSWRITKTFRQRTKYIATDMALERG